MKHSKHYPESYVNVCKIHEDEADRLCEVNGYGWPLINKAYAEIGNGLAVYNHDGQCWLIRLVGGKQ